MIVNIYNQNEFIENIKLMHFITNHGSIILLLED